MIIDIKQILSILSAIILALFLFKFINKDVIVIETNIDEKCKK